MQPVFKEFAKFLKDLGADISWFKEGYYWLDNNLIKGFRNGKLVFLYKIVVDDDLNLTFTKHAQNKDFNDLEPWNDTIERVKPRLKELENYAIKLIKEHSEGREVICFNSTGKDSIVVEALAKQTSLPFETYFNVTTLDVAETNRMANKNQYIKIFPEYKGGFYNWIHKNIIPTRLARGCCTYFKEGPTIKTFDKNKKYLFLYGMRNQESVNRRSYEDIWRNHLWGDRDWIGLLPIRAWSELDIWCYTLMNNLEINPKYKYGYTRVGCGIACPNYTKYTWILDKYWYPKLYNRWRNILKEDFIKHNRWLIMNCTLDEYLKIAWPGGSYRTEPTEEVIQEFADYSGLDFEIAKKYFNKTCCNSIHNRVVKIKDKNTLAMNMKYFGRNLEKFQCKRCLMRELNMTEDYWNKRIKSFKSQGCQLFD